MLRRRQNNNVPAVAVGIISRNPREAVGIFVATAAVGVIFVNALFWQSGPHPAPIFAPRLPSSASPIRPSVTTPLPPPRVENPSSSDVARPAGKAAKTNEPVRDDPIAQLLGPDRRIMAVQRVLAEFGYGQIRPTGTLDPQTQSAIKAFERTHKLPVTGAMSDQLIRALGAMSGHPIE